MCADCILIVVEEGKGWREELILKVFLFVTPWSVLPVFVLVSTPLQVSPIFPIIPWAFIPVFSVCCQFVLSCHVLPECLPVFMFLKGLFPSFPGSDHSACPDPEPAWHSVHTWLWPVYEPPHWAAGHPRNLPAYPSVLIVSGADERFFWTLPWHPSWASPLSPFPFPWTLESWAGAL